MFPKKKKYWRKNYQWPNILVFEDKIVEKKYSK